MCSPPGHMSGQMVRGPSSLVAGNTCEHVALLSDNVIGMFCMFQQPERPACVWWTAVFLSYIQM